MRFQESRHRILGMQIWIFVKNPVFKYEFLWLFIYPWRTPPEFFSLQPDSAPLQEPDDVMDGWLQVKKSKKIIFFPEASRALGGRSSFPPPPRSQPQSWSRSMHWLSPPAMKSMQKLQVFCNYNSYLPTRGSWEGSQAESAMAYIRSEIDNHLLPRSTSEWQSISAQDHTWICNETVSYLSSQPLTRVFLLEPSS